MGHRCRQTLLRVETCAHHVLTGTYDKRIITGLNCCHLLFWKQPFNLATLWKYLKSKLDRNKTYGTSHLLIGGGIFRGRVKKKYCCVRAGEGQYMKNKNIEGMFFVNTI